MATVTCAAGFQDPYGLGDLPSTTGVVCNPADYTDHYGDPFTVLDFAWWAEPWYEPIPGTWTFLVDAEAVGEPSTVGGAGMGTQDDGLNRYTDTFTVSSRAVYRVPGLFDFDTSYTIGLVGVTGPIRIFSLCLEPGTVVLRAIPRRQTGRTDGLLGAGRQVAATSLRQTQRVW